MGKLYVVGTPIGNLGDLSPRAAQVLSEVDFIAAEDTRVTMKLLSHLGIKKPMISYYEHNLREKGEIILSPAAGRGELRHRHRRGDALYFRPWGGFGGHLPGAWGPHRGGARPQRRRHRLGGLRPQNQPLCL